MNHDAEHVLLVEDDITVAKLYRKLIEKKTEGRFLVQHAVTLEAALGKLQDNLFSVVLTDLSLPDSSGFHTFEAIHEARPDLPVVVISGQGTKEEAIETVRRGAQDYLVKGQANADMIVRSLLYAMERKHLEKERHDMLYIHEQEQRLKSLGTMAAGLAHEINTPLQFVGTNIAFMRKAYMALSKILINCDRLRDADRNDPHREEIIDDIIADLSEKRFVFMRGEVEKVLQESCDGIHRLHEIVKAMSVFARSSEGHRVSYDINRAVRDAILLSRPQWKHCANIKLNLADDLPHVSCIAEKVHLAILNVIINAAQAVESAQKSKKTENEPHAKGVIHITTSQNDDYVEIQVADSGDGIPEDIRHRIFDPFFTTKEIGQGTGQGLSFVREIIVERHGGMVEVASNEGAGTVFRICLPIEEREKEKEETSTDKSERKFSERYASLLAKG